MSLFDFSLIRRHLLFVLYCMALTTTIIEYLAFDYLLTNIQGPSGRASQRLNLFSIIVGLADDLFLVLSLITIAILHQKYPLLSIDRNQSLIAQGLNFLYHMCFLFPIHLNLVLHRGVSVHFYVLVYNYQLFIISSVVLNYAKRMYDLGQEIRVAMKRNNDYPGEPNFTFAIQCHRKNSKIFQELNQAFGDFNFVIVIHAVVVITIQTNVILMYIFNEGYKRTETILRLIFLILWSGSSFLQLVIVSIASHHGTSVWKSFEKKLTSHCPSYTFRAILLERQFMINKFFVIDNEFLFNVREEGGER